MTMSGDTNSDDRDRTWWDDLHDISDDLRCKIVEAHFRAIIMRTRLWVRKRDIVALSELLEDIVEHHVLLLEQHVEVHPGHGWTARMRRCVDDVIRDETKSAADE
jgi:hypothetical protein